MTETEHAQWIKQFWKDKLDEMKGADRMRNDELLLNERVNSAVNAVLEQIRAEIEQSRYGLVNDGLDLALKIIDKHMGDTQ